MRWLLAVLLGCLITRAEGADVSVSNVHLCCDSCVSGVEEALADVEGVSKVSSDKNTKIIRFTVVDDKAADAGIKALAEHGFFGQAKLGSKKLAFPDNGAKKGEKANQIELEGVHLCCGACVTGAKDALKNIGGISTIDVERAAGRIVLKGAGMETTKALDALNAAGFYAKLKKNEKAKSAQP